jgi:hypothetical protein
MLVRVRRLVCSNRLGRFRNISRFASSPFLEEESIQYALFFYLQNQLNTQVVCLLFKKRKRLYNKSLKDRNNLPNGWRYSISGEVKIDTRASADLQYVCFVLGKRLAQEQCFAYEQSTYFV